MAEKNWQEILDEMDRKDYNACRRYRRHNLSLDRMGEVGIKSESENEWEELIEKELKKLTWKQRRVLKMLYFRGYSQKETAKLLRCTESAVSHLKRRALSELRKNLNK